MLRVLKIVMADDRIYFSLNSVAIRHTLPGSSYTIHQAVLYRFPPGEFKIFYSLSALPRHAKALALMLAAAFGGYFTISFTQQRIKPPNVHGKLVTGGSIIATEIKRIPKYSFCLPWLYA